MTSPRAATLPRALEVEIAEFEAAIEDFLCEEGEREEYEQKIEAHEEERRELLAALGVDEVEWEHRTMWRRT